MCSESSVFYFRGEFSETHTKTDWKNSCFEQPAKASDLYKERLKFLKKNRIIIALI